MTSPDSASVSANGTPVPALVQVSGNEFAVFGGLDLEGVVVEPALLLPDSVRRDLHDATAVALGLANLGGQGAAALGAFEGLVRLAPATIQAMQAGAVPMTNGVANLGSLVNSSGAIVQSVQWTATGPTGVGAGLIAIGPAIAILAVQMQLAKINRLVAENMRLSDTILTELRTERWTKVQALQSTMLDMIDEAQRIGVVNEHIWQNVASSERDLQASRAHHRAEVEDSLRKLKDMNDPKMVREFFDHHGSAILGDVQGLLQAQAAWYTYQAIRAGHLHDFLESDPSAAAHLAVVVEKAKAQHEDDLSQAARLIDGLVRRASSLEEAKPGATLPFLGKKKAAKEVARSAAGLQEKLGSLRDSWGVTNPPLPEPRIVVVERKELPKALGVLRWHLGPNERLLGIAKAQDQSPNRGSWNWRLQDAWLYVAMTDERLIVAKEKHLTEIGQIAGSIPLESIRFARYKPGRGKPNKSSAKLHIVSADRDLSLTFADWATNSVHTAQVDQFAQLVQSVMRLPHGEVPASPILEPFQR